MATEPVGDQNPPSAPARRSAAEEIRRLRAERDALEQRALEAERRAEALAAELAEARAELDVDPGRLSLFDDLPDEEAGPRAADGSDPAVLPIALGATALVAAMVALLAALDRGLGSPVALVMLGLACLLAYLAWNSRVERFEVSVSRGMVYIDSSSNSYRFDLRQPTTEVEMTGRPGEGGWQVRFLRRHLDPFTVDATMVEPAEFVRQLREWRPEL
ncbi:MAG TPA: hypothetical protein VFO49_19460 [Nocardioides sp.]|nr:hypothetical protein [Nocardioides sp.]